MNKARYRNKNIRQVLNEYYGENAPVLSDEMWSITKPEKPIGATAALAVAQNVDNWSIDDIRSITEEIALVMSDDHEKIKGHDCYFIDFGIGWGYTVLVFFNGHQIRFAGDSALHHHGESRVELKEIYVKKLTEKLYTDEELASPIRSYSDLQNRENYLLDYYGDRENHVSFYHIFNEEGMEEWYREETAGLYTSYITHAHYKSEEFCKKVQELWNGVEKAKEKLATDFDFWKNAFYHEFFNHECMYGGRFTEAAYATGCGTMNDTMKEAFKAAKRDFNKWCAENDY